jgi:hypothetical protein
MNVPMPDELLEDILLWEAEDEKLFERLRLMEEKMLEMEVGDESESFN